MIRRVIRVQLYEEISFDLERYSLQVGPNIEPEIESDQESNSDQVRPRCEVLPGVIRVKLDHEVKFDQRSTTQRSGFQEC